VRVRVFSKDKSETRPLIEINCDTDLLANEVKEDKVNVQDLVLAIRGAMEEINKAVLRGQRMAKEDL